MNTVPILVMVIMSVLQILQMHRLSKANISPLMIISVVRERIGAGSGGMSEYETCYLSVLRYADDSP